MSLEFYRILHVIGAVAALMAYGGVLMHGMNGGSRATNPSRGIAAAFHGIGMLLLLVAGFGMLAKLQISSPSAWGGWLYTKLVLWLALGGLLGVGGKRPDLAKVLWWLIPVIAALATWLGIAKPF